jgi:hypothetical protein
MPPPLEEIVIPAQKIRALLDFHDDCIVLRSALNVRMSGILTGALKIGFAGRGPSETFARITEHVLIPLCYEVALYMSALGVVPVRLVEASVVTRNDQARKRRYSELGSASTRDLVPTIPHWSTYE